MINSVTHGMNCNRQKAVLMGVHGTLVLVLLMFFPRTIIGQDFYRPKSFLVSHDTDLVLLDDKDAELISVGSVPGGYFSRVSASGIVNYHANILFDGVARFRARVKRKDGMILPYTYEIYVLPAIIEQMKVSIAIDDTLTADLNVHVATTIFEDAQVYGRHDSDLTLKNGKQILQFQLPLRPGIPTGDLNDHLKCSIEVKGVRDASPFRSATMALVASARSPNDLVLLRNAKNDSPEKSVEGITYAWTIPKPVIPEVVSHTEQMDDFGQGDTSYSISVGASFDLFNGASVDNVYSSVQTFLPRLWKFNIPWTSVPLQVGLDAGFAQRRTIQPKQNSGRRDRYWDSQKRAIIADSISAETNTKWDNISLFCNPTIFITKGVYLFSNIEFRKATKKTVTTYSRVTTSSVPGVPSNAADTTLMRNPIYQQDSTGENSDDEIILGPGALLEYEDGNIDFYIAASYNLRYRDHPSNWLMEFKMTEKRSLISVGGEVRNILGADNQYLIYLAKEFPLSFLAEIFGGSRK